MTFSIRMVFLPALVVCLEPGRMHTEEMGSGLQRSGWRWEWEGLFPGTRWAGWFMGADLHGVRGVGSREASGTVTTG